jgi:hypothetical protein
MLSYAVRIPSPHGLLHTSRVPFVDGTDPQGTHDMRAARAFLTWLAATAIAASAARAHALDVDPPEWGFDGHVVPMAFNIVTIGVRNSSNTPFEGDILLQEGNAALRGDLPLVEKGLYIEPGGYRRLQFFPFITESWVEYRLIWGEGDRERVSVAGNGYPLKTGPRAVVLLRDALTSRLLRARVPSFDESDFPIAAPGTDTLRGVVLDHVPRWDSLRLQAFRDWIGGGGRVHILRGANNEYPKFPAPLEALNEPSDSAPLGSGRVLHHPMTVGDMTDEFVTQTLGLVPRSPDDNQQANQYDYNFQPGNSIAPLLRELTRPDHNWGLIYFLSFIYLLVVFPGCWLLGRRRADFRISYPALLAAVFLFSMAFKTVGQRGYGEETAWNAVGTARRVAPGRFLTECWSNSFVTSGGMYTYSHNAEGQIYSSGGSNDTRRGACVNRPSAEITTEIPPFSSQLILNTGIVTAPDFDLKLTSLQGSGPSTSASFEISGAFPRLLSMHAAVGDQRLLLTQAGQSLVTGGVTPLSSTINANQNYGYNSYRGSVRDAALIYSSAENPLVARSLRLSGELQGNELRPPKDTIRVFLYAEMPAEFLDVKNGPPKRQGRLLYIFDFPIES